LLVEHADLFWRALRAVEERVEFDVVAHALLPDHCHLLIDVRGGNFTNAMQRLKMSFGMYYRKRADVRSGRVWQHRYWDHVIRDQDDMNRHIDYVHYNAVKHGYVQNPAEWLHSSFRNYFDRGIYEADWGVTKIPRLDGEFGE
jgi:putative transposase